MDDTIASLRVLRSPTGKYGYVLHLPGAPVYAEPCSWETLDALLRDAAGDIAEHQRGRARLGCGEVP